jgi:hypothetical protein
MSTPATTTLVAVRALEAARSRRRPSTPAALAKRMIANYRITPTIALSPTASRMP